MNLFSNVKYELAAQEIETVYNPGIANTLMMIAKYPFDFARGPGIMHCWNPDTSTGAANANRGFEARR